MDLANVTEQDGRAAANLLQLLAVANRLLDALKLAGMPVQGPGLGDREATSRWFGALASKMANELKAAPTPTEGMRVRSAGPLAPVAGTPAKSRKRRKS